jgi:hypothetical protein
VVIVPAICTAVGLVASAMVVYFAASTEVGNITPVLKICITTSFSLHATTNILCTCMSLSHNFVKNSLLILETIGMIVFRIFRNSMSVSSSKSHLLPLVWVIVESAAIYT